MINVKNVTKHDLQNKVKWFILHIFKLFRKFLKNPLIGSKVYYCTHLASTKTAVEVLLTMKLPSKSKHDANGSLLYLKSFVCSFMSAGWFKILSRLHLLFLLNKIYDFKLQESFPNVCIWQRILLTIPATVSSAERSFSKLKLIKNWSHVVYLAKLNI